MRSASAPPTDALPFLVDVHGPGVRRSLAQLSRIADRSFRLLGHVSFDAAGPDRYRMRFEREAIARRIHDEGVLALSNDLRDGFSKFMAELQAHQGRLPVEATLEPTWQALRREF